VRDIIICLRANSFDGSVHNAWLSLLSEMSGQWTTSRETGLLCTFKCLKNFNFISAVV
jgi:hypothetical protein